MDNRLDHKIVTSYMEKFLILNIFSEFYCTCISASDPVALRNEVDFWKSFKVNVRDIFLNRPQFYSPLHFTI
jgi:hypothetical protein